MGRTRTANPPKPAAPEPQNQDLPAVSKAEAVRQALAEGLDGIGDIGEFIKAKYGIEMPKPIISSYKAQQKARDAKRNRASSSSKTPKRGKPAEGYLAPPPRIEPTGEGDLIDILEKMKPLIAQHGAEKIKRIVDLLG